MAITCAKGRYSVEIRGDSVRLKPLHPDGLNFKRAIPTSILEASLAGDSKTVNGPSAGIFATFSRENDKLLVTLRFPDKPTDEVSFDADDVELELLMVNEAK